MSLHENIQIKKRLRISRDIGKVPERMPDSCIKMGKRVPKLKDIEEQPVFTCLQIKKLLLLG